MNKRSIIAIAVLAILLVGGIYYTIQEQQPEDISSEEDNLSQEDIVDESEFEEGESSTLPEDYSDEEVESQPEEVILEQGKPAPDFTLTTLEGEKATLSDYRGKIVMINFWGTWCPWCDKEMPDLQRLYEENKDDDFVVLAVNVGDSESTARNYIEEGGYTFPVLLDSKDEVSRRKYFVSSFPTSYYIDKDGNLIGAVPGMMTYPQMNQVLEQIRNGDI